MTITQQVKNILKVSELARNDHKELLIIYMQKSGMNLSKAQIATFKDMPDLWTVRRTCQKIQENGEYTASEAVDAARFNKYKEIRNTIPNQTANTTENILTKYRVKEWGEY